LPEAPPFERSVFINCPFDRDYAPVLQAIIFCIVFLGFSPRLASERTDSAENRLIKIREIIEGSKFSIHDLSRSQAANAGDLFRLNMPFELGVDYGCRQYCGNGRDQKKILILEEKPYRYQAALSDLSGCDIQVHGADYQVAVRKVRNWLVNEANARKDGAARILARYVDFQEWHYETQLAAGFSDEDIQDYPTRELLDAMVDWMQKGMPV
jgi:hypothetical protein